MGGREGEQLASVRIVNSVHYNVEITRSFFVAESVLSTNGN